MSMEVIRERNGIFVDNRVVQELPCDIDEWITLQKKNGFEIGIVDMVRRRFIYKSLNFMGYPNYDTTSGTTKI